MPNAFFVVANAACSRNANARNRAPVPNSMLDSRARAAKSSSTPKCMTDDDFTRRDWNVEALRGESRSTHKLASDRPARVEYPRQRATVDRKGQRRPVPAHQLPERPAPASFADFPCARSASNGTCPATQQPNDPSPTPTLSFGSRWVEVQESARTAAPPERIHESGPSSFSPVHELVPQPVLHKFLESAIGRLERNAIPTYFKAECRVVQV
jgi:hypothetical protein